MQNTTDKKRYSKSGRVIAPKTEEDITVEYVQRKYFPENPKKLSKNHYIGQIKYLYCKKKLNFRIEKKLFSNFYEYCVYMGAYTDSTLKRMIVEELREWRNKRYRRKLFYANQDTGLLPEKINNEEIPF